MLVKKIFFGLKLYIFKCLITPLFISFGVVLFVYVVFFNQLSFANSVVNMLTSYEPQTDKSIYNQTMTAIVGNTAAEVDIIYPLYGDKFAELSIESIKKKSVPVFNSDDYLHLSYGWGRSSFSKYPGEGGKIIMAGHIMTNADIYDVKIGDEIVLKTHYGTFRYSVTSLTIVKDTDLTIMKPDNSKEQLVMYTCYPLHKLGHLTQRLVITSILKSGPVVKNILFKDN